MLRYLLITALAAVCYFANPLFAQTGPGGVGNTYGASDLVLWLDANTINQPNNSEVVLWNDNSVFLI